MKKGFETQQVYFVGGGLASLAGAVYLVRDCDFPGKNIHILESLKLLGGSNDGAGSPQNGFVVRGGRMLNDETYENLWELLSTIPSLEMKGKSVRDEIVAFDTAHPTRSKARLVDSNGKIPNVKSMGFNTQDRLVLGKLMLTPEEKLDNLRICDWFEKTPHFFETNFWYMWQTTFAFQKWSSLTEFKRYLQRMIKEFPRIETLEGVTRTTYNQYDSIILPLKIYLDQFDVNYHLDFTVTDLDFKPGAELTVTAIHYRQAGKEQVINLKDGDLCIVTNGCMTDNSTLGYTDRAPALNFAPAPSAQLWEKLAAKKPGLGDPQPFYREPELSNWESFTITCQGTKFLELAETFTHNKPGNGLVTFKDSSWLMSFVIPVQPHFKNQPKDVAVIWGYGLYTNNLGDYVKKPMRECTGAEILNEMLHQLHFTEADIQEILQTSIVIPCLMPYIISMFQPRAFSDRPQVVPPGSTNFAMISQFVEIPEDMVFTEEYSVRAARMAVYKLMGIEKPICPVTPYSRQPGVLFTALKTSFR